MNTIFLRRYAKFLSLSILLLIFMGALVKSTDSGLSVPDWPTTYGHFMFSFPLDQMVGGIKYEHTHRMWASIVGLLTLALTIMLYRSKVSAGLKKAGLIAFIMVVLQGLLGGLTVLHYLPAWLSTFHGVLGQVYFITSIFIAYLLSQEYQKRQHETVSVDIKFTKMVFILFIMIFIQLFLGNLVRHTESALAIPDFPTMGGSLWPNFSAEWLAQINHWRFEHNLEPVTMGQVHMHLTHRIWGFLILFKLLYIDYLAYQRYLGNVLVMKSLFLLNIAVSLQIMLGIATVLLQREPLTTSLHVTLGAILLALNFILWLRCKPVRQ